MLAKRFLRFTWRRFLNRARLQPVKLPPPKAKKIRKNSNWKQHRRKPRPSSTRKLEATARSTPARKYALLRRPSVTRNARSASVPTVLGMNGGEEEAIAVAAVVVDAASAVVSRPRCR